MYFVTPVLNGMLDNLDVRATHVSLHTADPGSTGASEVGSLPYLRQPLTWAAAGGGAKLASPVTFQVPGSVTITHFGFWDADTGGVFAGGAELAAPATFPVDNPYVLAVQATTDAITALPLSGGTLTGPLLISPYAGAPDYSTLPLGRAGSAPPALGIISSFSGGEDEAGGGDTDTTGRIDFWSYQRAESTSYGESIRFFPMELRAKTMLAWYRPTAGYDEDGAPIGEAWNPVAWVGAHIGANDMVFPSANPELHNHWSIEVPDAAGALQTRFEVPFAAQGTGVDQSVLGINHTNLKTNLADLTVRADGSKGYPGGRIGVFRISGSNTSEKVIELGTGNAETGWEGGRRWRIVGTDATESGGGAGTDLAVRRYADDGTMLGTGLLIKRSNGNAVFGQSSVEGARVAAVWGAANEHGFLAKSSSSPGAGAAYAAVMSTGTDRLFDGRVSGDSIARLLINVTGQIEWGPGGASRDVNLYRQAADVLRTDDSFQAGGGLAVTGAATVGGTLAVTGASTFVGAVTVPTPTTNGHAVTKLYVDDLVGSGIGTVPRARIERIADLTLTTGTVTAVPLLTSVYEVGGDWWTTGNNLIVPTGAGGLYMVSVRAIFKSAGANTGERSVWVRRLVGGPIADDPPIVSQTNTGPGGAGWTDVTATDQAVLTAGQTYYVSVRQGLGAVLDLYGVQVSFIRVPGT